MLRFSTGLKNGILNATGVKAALAAGVLKLYSGAQPISADLPATGTLLMQVTVDAGAFTPGSATNGLDFDAPADGILSKAAAEVWRGVGLAAGVAGYYRFCANATDDNSESTTLIRVDGSVGRTSADLILSNTTIAVGVPTTIDAYNIACSQG